MALILIATSAATAEMPPPGHPCRHVQPRLFQVTEINRTGRIVSECPPSTRPYIESGGHFKEAGRVISHI